MSGWPTVESLLLIEGVAIAIGVAGLVVCWLIKRRIDKRRGMRTELFLAADRMAYLYGLLTGLGKRSAGEASRAQFEYVKRLIVEMRLDAIADELSPAKLAPSRYT